MLLGTGLALYSGAFYAHCCVFLCRNLGKRACMLLPHTKIINFYGPTEATIGVSHWLVNGGNCEGVSNLPIGGPIANTHFYVLDADLKQVPIGMVAS